MRFSFPILTVALTLCSCEPSDAPGYTLRHWEVRYKSFDTLTLAEVDTLYDNSQFASLAVHPRARLYRTDSALSALGNAFRFTDTLYIDDFSLPADIREVGCDEILNLQPVCFFDVALTLIPQSSLTLNYIYSPELGVLEEWFPHARWGTPDRHRVVRLERSDTGVFFVPDWDAFDAERSRADLSAPLLQLDSLLGRNVPPLPLDPERP